jgi:hypothetical protein
VFVTAINFGYYGVSAGTIGDEHNGKLEMASEVFIDKKPDYYTFVGERKRMTEEEFQAMFSDVAGEEGGQAETGGDDNKSGDDTDVNK